MFFGASIKLYSHTGIDLLAVYNISSFMIMNINHHNSNISGDSIRIGNSLENNSTANRL